MIMSRKLNLGCGNNPVPDYVNIDKLPLPEVDLVWDLEICPLPIPDNCVSEVRCDHILEHIHNFLPLMEELHRVCQPGAVLKINAPYYKYEQAYGDPTHVRFFNERTFSFFDDDYEYGFYTKARFFTRVVKLKNTSKTKTVTPVKRIRRYIPFKQFFNIFLWNMFSEIYYELEVVKDEEVSK